MVDFFVSFPEPATLRLLNRNKYFRNIERGAFFEKRKNMKLFLTNVYFFL